MKVLWIGQLTTDTKSGLRCKNQPLRQEQTCKATNYGFVFMCHLGVELCKIYCITVINRQSKQKDLVIRHYMEKGVMIQYFGSLCLVVQYLIQTKYCNMSLICCIALDFLVGF